MKLPNAALTEWYIREYRRGLVPWRYQIGNKPPFELPPETFYTRLEVEDSYYWAQRTILADKFTEPFSVSTIRRALEFLEEEGKLERYRSSDDSIFWLHREAPSRLLGQEGEALVIRARALSARLKKRNVNMEVRVSPTRSDSVIIKVRKDFGLDEFLYLMERAGI